jgi:hypothetical protein
LLVPTNESLIALASPNGDRPQHLRTSRPPRRRIFTVDHEMRHSKSDQRRTGPQ